VNAHRGGSQERGETNTLLGELTMMRIALVAVGTTLGLWLLNDSMTFTLYADQSGMRGCYTQLEVAMGRLNHTTIPSDGIRFAELLSGAALGVLLPTALLCSSLYRRRQFRKAD
jgi:hypothetical protein